MTNNQKTIKEAINELLAAYGLDTKMKERLLINSWEELMGKTISKYTTGLYIKNKVLYVKINSSIVKNELSYSKSSIIKTLNDHVKDELILDIVFN